MIGLSLSAACAGDSSTGAANPTCIQLLERTEPGGEFRPRPNVTCGVVAGGEWSVNLFDDGEVANLELLKPPGSDPDFPLPVAAPGNRLGTGVDVDHVTAVSDLLAADGPLVVFGIAPQEASVVRVSIPGGGDVDATFGPRTSAGARTFAALIVGKPPLVTVTAFDDGVRLGPPEELDTSPS